VKKKYIIVAADEKYGIGKDGKLPWHFSSELKYFKKVTTQTKDPSKKNAVVMGRKTWESIPEKYRPLPKRVNIVLTRKDDFVASGAEVANSYDAALEICNGSSEIENIFIIGGAQIYEETLSKVDGVYLTRIADHYYCDRFLDPKSEIFQKEPSILGKDMEKGVEFTYYLYLR